MMCGVGTSSGSIPLLLTSGMALVALLGGSVGWLLLMGRRPQSAQSVAGFTPIEALRERYAHGEIDLDTFEQMATHLIRSPATVSRTQRDEPLPVQHS